MEYFIESTKRYRITQIAKHYPTHCTISIVSEHDKTILAAAELMTAINITVPSTKDNVKHTKIIDQLT